MTGSQEVAGSSPAVSTITRQNNKKAGLIFFQKNFQGSDNKFRYKLIPVSNYIKNLIRQGEHQKLDFKYEISDARKIARTLVAFSNTDGGKLLIGVKDNGTLKGIRSDEEFYMIESAAHLYSKPKIAFKWTNWTIEDKTILEVTIPKGKANTIYYAPDKDKKWKAYVRIYDQNIMANYILLQVWRRHNMKRGTYIQYTNKEKLLLDYLKANKMISLSKFCRIAKISRKDAEKVLIKLILFRIIEIVFTKTVTYYQLTENMEVDTRKPYFIFKASVE